MVRASQYIMGLLISCTLMAGSLDAQDPLATRRNSIQVGYLLSVYVPIGYGTVGYERLVGQRLSLNLTAGVSPFRPRSANPLYTKLDLYGMAEGRYYFNFRRKRKMAGFYAGVAISRENPRSYYRGTSNLSVKAYWDSIGLTLGYQHALGDRMRLNLGLMPQYTRQETSTFYDNQGNITYRGVLPIGFIYTFFFRFGITL